LLDPMTGFDTYVLEAGVRPRDVEVLVAMSGGVDSAVAAALLARRGYSVAGATLKLWCFAEDFRAGRLCCSAEALEDAAAVCRFLGVPHYVVDLRAEFRRDVVEPFCREYLAARTPNPCVACNAEIKFKAFLRRALDMGARFIATGHHVRQIRGPGGAFSILRGADPRKDQSYALWGLTQGVLAHTLFPIGWLTKSEVRREARAMGLPVAEKEESQDVCFVPGGDISELLRDVAPEGALPGRGEIRDASEAVVGRHDGYYRYTIGQRRGLGVARGRRCYVTGIDAARNVVYVGDDSELMGSAARVAHFNFIEDRALGTGNRAHVDGSVSAKIRYMHPAAPGRLELVGEGGVRFVFDEPQRAITPGQSLVVYEGDRVVGGGVIERAER